MRKKSFLVAMLIGSVLMTFVHNAAAQDLDPRRYVNLPVGQNFLRFAFGRSEGDVGVSPSIPIEGGQLDVNAVSLAYMGTFDIGGEATSFDAYMPYVCATGSALVDGEPRYRDVCGWGDASIRITHNFIGAPAMELSEYVKAEKEFVFGASLQVGLPVGKYDPGYLLNIGANRWVLRPEIGMSIPWKSWSFEFAAGVRFFSDNDEYLDGSTQSQDPLYNVQAHIVYDISPGQWISLDGNYFFGGRTYRDGVEAMIQQENSRIGVNWYIVLKPNLGLRLTAHTGVVTRVGNDSDMASVAFIYRWE